MTSNRPIQYVYAPSSGKSRDAEVFFGKPKNEVQIKTDKQYEDEKDDTPKIKTVGTKRSSLVKATRNSLNVTQEDFAKQLGVAKNVVTLYENPNSIFNPKEWDKIMHGIDIINNLKKKNKN